MSLVLLVVAGLLLGLAHVAALPPWEGLDEVAHYSYVQQLADRGEVPRMPVDRISADAEAYMRTAPIPYASVLPFDANGGVTYRDLFRSPPEAIAAARATVHEPPPAPRRYEPGEQPNWQAQHPPLYYAVMTPVYAATRGLDWGRHLFALRAVSYAIAWGGWVLALYVATTTLPAVRGEPPSLGGWTVTATAAWPFVLPVWFPTMARMGNDSLSLLLMTAVWWLTLRALTHGLTWRRGGLLGALLGLGALTKVFFVPAAAGLGAFWVVRAWRRPDPASRGAMLGPLALAAVVMIAIAGWWYAWNWRDHGNPLVTWDSMKAADQGGVVAGLRVRGSVFAWVRSLAAFVTTMGWAGTQSLARLSAPFLAPIALIVLLLGAAYVTAVRRRDPRTVAWLPAWMTVPMIAGLVHHTLVQLSRTGLGVGTPAYYLHVFVAPLGVAVGFALRAWWRQPAFRAVFGAVGMYAVVFAVAMSWAQALLFSGILYKDDEKLYHATGALPPLFAVSEVLARLRVLAYPDLALAAWLAGGACAVVGLVALWRRAGQLADRDDPTDDQGFARTHSTLSTPSGAGVGRSRVIR